MKLNLSNITSGYGAVAALNANFDAIETAVENTLSRDGTTPNEMLANLDMNGNDILNANAVDVASLTINGTPVQPATGVTVSQAFQSYTFTATLGQTSFSVSPHTPYVASVQVEVNGLSLPPADITVSGTNVVIPACSAGDEVVIRRYTDAPSPFPVASDITFQPAGTIQTRSVQSKLRDVVSVKDFGAVGDNVTDDTLAFQNAIDYANSVWVGGSQLGGGITIYIPPGRYKLGALIYKNGVNLQGAGKMHTQLRVFGNNTTLIAASSNTSTMTSAGNLYYGSWKDFAILSWEGATGSTPIGQVGWDAIGFSRWYCENIYFGWGAGFVAIRLTNAILAGSGGPSNWYNTFIGCAAEKHYLGAGGVGLLLGDTSAGKEQITTWNWIGGYIRGSGDGTGTGLNIQSATGCTFYGVCFEANGNAILLGSAPGTRFANSVDFIGCYWEGNTVNWNVYAGCVNNGFIGGFVTGGTGTDNGSYTRFSIAGATKSHIQGASAADYWRVQMINGGLNRPQFTGSSFPSIGLENSSGTEVVLGNGAATSSATDYFGVYADDLSLLLKAGLVSATVRAPTINLANSSVGITVSSGSPEGTFAAPVGSLYMRTDGGAGTTLYVKQSGTGNTGWVGK